MSASCRDELPKMSDFGVDSTEACLLQVLRFQCHSYFHDTTLGFDKAFEEAEAKFGAEKGSLIAAFSQTLLRVLRTSNSGRFNYLSPTCPCCREKITAQEWLLIVLLRAVRVGNFETAEAAAGDLCDCKTVPRVLAAASKITADLGTGKPTTIHVADGQTATLH